MPAPEQLRVRIGRNVRRLRESMGLSQRAFAIRLGLEPEGGRTYVVSVEAGKRTVSLARLAHLADCLAVDACELLAPQKKASRSRGVASS